LRVLNWASECGTGVWPSSSSIIPTIAYAFQYADWVFDGDDILFVSRTAAADEEGEPITITMRIT
jgi:hypothetical protein